MSAALLILLVPWAVSHVKAAPRRWQAWSAIALYVAMSVSLDFPVVLGLVTRASEHSLLSFLLLRQVALASVILLLVLYLSLREELLDVRQVSATTTTPDEQLSAA